MCGRLNVIDNPLCRIVCEQVGVNFQTTTNHDLRPTQYVSTVGIHNNELVQLDLLWGIKPSWANRIIINAQAETVAVKPTFAQAFEFNRVIVPCSGWYEWREEQGKKVKYLFSSENHEPFYMAGIALEGGSKLVTLTTKPNEQCNGYHHRMPLFIPRKFVVNWVSGPNTLAKKLLNSEFDHGLSIKRA
ncbi:SOS response-associated peptidase [Vibrio brasiliensis]|uniref:SOS response-associated peptidase n=1 Tax=Vibrio brasiliensis TaxID=170652 RepID=UPI001EFDC54F|nr:SOS response-associated peptidase family protein [Vibrio brasiliensis]MCG9724504.1 SOS response-associated peptidase [Vibrio brasiliensis]